MSADGGAFDLFVLGGGSGGVRTARVAARLGARVAICEEYRWGGTCVIRGCVPKKLLMYASHFREDLEDAAGFGWTIGEARHDWAALIAAKDVEIARLEGVYHQMLESAGITVVAGRGRIEGPGLVRVGERTFSARHIVIATGGRPEKIPIPGIEHAITSNEALQLPSLPERVTVVGAGYVAVEFACIFHGLGAKVDLVFRADRPLRGFDDEIRTFLAEELTKKGIHLRAETTVARIDPVGTAFRLTTGSGEAIDTDLVMYATGRVPCTADLGLASVGVKLDARGAVVVDAYSATHAEGIHAVGDVTDRIALTPVALGEGQALAQTLFGPERIAFDHRDVPCAVFGQPPIAVVGLSEQSASEGGRALDVYTSHFRPLKNTVSGRHERTFMKLVVDRASQRVLGCHMLGADAAEIIQGLAIAVKMGATKAQLDATVGIHPTAAEEFVTMRAPRPA
jgi:glutathione reductase (NADPH)